MFLDRVSRNVHLPVQPLLRVDRVVVTELVGGVINVLQLPESRNTPRLITVSGLEGLFSSGIVDIGDDIAVLVPGVSDLVDPMLGPLVETFP